MACVAPTHAEFLAEEMEYISSIPITDARSERRVKYLTSTAAEHAYDACVNSDAMVQYKLCVCGPHDQPAVDLTPYHNAISECVATNLFSPQFSDREAVYSFCTEQAAALLPGPTAWDACVAAVDAEGKCEYEGRVAEADLYAAAELEEDFLAIAEEDLEADYDGEELAAIADELAFAAVELVAY
eukprot:tig00021178_g19205.t1